MGLVLFGLITVIIAVVTTTAYVVGQKQLTSLDGRIGTMVDQVNRTGMTTYELDKKQEHVLGKYGKNIIDMEATHAETTSQINSRLGNITTKIQGLDVTDAKLARDITTLDNTVKSIPTESQLRRISALERTDGLYGTRLTNLETETSKNIPNSIKQTRDALLQSIATTNNTVAANKTAQTAINTKTTTDISSLDSFRTSTNNWRANDIAPWQSSTNVTLTDHKQVWRPKVDAFMTNHQNVLNDITDIRQKHVLTSTYQPKVTEFTGDITYLKNAVDATVPQEYVKKSAYEPVKQSHSDSITKLFGIVGADGTKVVTQTQLTDALSQRSTNVSNDTLWTFQTESSKRLGDLETGKADKQPLADLKSGFDNFKGALDSFYVTLQDTDANKTPYAQMGKTTSSTNTLNLARANAAGQFNENAEVDDIIIKGNNTSKRTILSGGTRQGMQTNGDVVLKNANVGVGVKDPIAKLDVNETNAQGWAAQIKNGNTGVRLGRGDGKVLEVYNGQTVNMGADANGNMGMNGQLNVAAIKAHPNTYNQPLPDGWGGGIQTFDLYANATIAAGTNKAVATSMNSAGDIYASRNATIGNTLNAGNLQIGGQNVATQSWVNNNSAPQWNNIANKPTTLQSGIDKSVDNWKTSADGTNRFYFQNNGRTYYGARNGHEWRNSADQAVKTINDDGGQFAWGKNGGDWNWRQYNPNGGNVHLNHGHGYGIHVNTNNKENGRYALETHNGARTTFHVRNDGELVQYRKDGRATHFDHVDNQNYIRGNTIVDGSLNVHEGNLNVRNDLVFHGDNGWIVHTPDDGRKTMYIAPWSGGNWAWHNQVRLENDGRLVTNVLQLGEKFRLSGVGDGHGNDGWLRLFNTQNSGYYGGLAAGHLWSGTGGLSGSDKNMKTNIQLLDQQDMQKINDLKPTKYNLKEDTSRREVYGFIAQDVEKVYPEMVYDGPNKLKSLNYDQFIPLLTKNVQNLNKNLPQSDKLCLGDVCITKDELLKLKKQASS